MKLPGLKLLDTVKINGIHFYPEVRVILDAARETAPELSDNTVWITSAADGKHKAGSKHYTSEAFDLRIKNVKGFKPGQLNIPAARWAERLRATLGFNYDVIYGDKGHLDHIHIELDPD